MPPKQFRITTASADGAHVVRLHGDLDLAAAPSLEAVLDEQSAKGGLLVLDLSGLDYIDAAGIRVLVSAWRFSQRDGFDLRLTRGSDRAMRALEICGLIDQLPFDGAVLPPQRARLDSNQGPAD
ncbi:MAG: STAS domain-containing protein [Solirubrobacteraceae bacterium]